MIKDGGEEERSRRADMIIRAKRKICDKIEIRRRKKR
jgi:hypothetical protein